MQGRAFWLFERSLLFVVAIAIGMATLAVSLSAPPTPVALAGVAADNDNDDDDDDDEERTVRGQVIEISRDKDPPEIAIAVVRDEIIPVRVLKKDELDVKGVNVGDHVRLRGEYVKEYFETNEIDVTDRCCPPPDNDDD